MTPADATLLARYNRWINARMLAACGTLDDAARRKPRGAFFGSIHGTLNHILLADRIWLGRFVGPPFSVTALDQELYSDFLELSRERSRTDDAIDRWTAGLEQTTLAGELRYTSSVRPEPRCYPYALAVTHFFNHQTHHRGQLCVLLSQCGIDYGVTDLIALPGSELV